jgi:hypothetical protein
LANVLISLFSQDIMTIAEGKILAMTVDATETGLWSCLRGLQFLELIQRSDSSSVTGLVFS